jgi:hypothetical protein
LTKKKIATMTVTAIETVIEIGNHGAIETATATGTVTATEIGNATEGTQVSLSPGYKLPLYSLKIPNNLLLSCHHSSKQAWWWWWWWWRRRRSLGA